MKIKYIQELWTRKCQVTFLACNPYTGNFPTTGKKAKVSPVDKVKEMYLTTKD